MSTNGQGYAIIFATANGTLLAEAQNISTTRTTASQPIYTIAKGYAGESPGAPMMEIDVKNAVPSAGFEFDMGKFMASLTPIDVQVIGPGGKTANGKAFVISDSLTQGVNQEASYEFKARMPLTLFL